MAKLIDVEAVYDAIGYGPRECQMCKRAIDRIPAVDAIPVEWIFEQMQILHELHNKNEYVLQWLTELWQKEQEAAKGE